MYKILIVLLLSANVFAQTNSVQVNYSLKIGFDEGFSNNDVLKDYYAMAQKGANDINFDLVANKTSSYFKLKETIKTEETDFAIAFSVAATSYYTESNSNNKIKYINDIFGEFRIEYNETTDWKLENETKYIDDYLCYKATSKQIVVTPKKTFEHPIVAWYCPSIPFSFGPNGYNGLPGLILELQIRNITWGASKIVLTKEIKVVEKPSKGKKITSEEYTKLLSTPPF